MESSDGGGGGGGELNSVYYLFFFFPFLIFFFHIISVRTLVVRFLSRPRRSSSDVVIRRGRKPNAADF